MGGQPERRWGWISTTRVDPPVPDELEPDDEPGEAGPVGSDDADR